MVDGYVFEALRFKPPFPYFFRVCETDTALARNTDHETRISAGTTVLALVQSAMFDPSAASDAETFDPTRSPGSDFLFGYGLHECLGRAIGRVMVPEIVRQGLRPKGLEAGDVDTQGGPFPETWAWRWPIVQ